MTKKELKIITDNIAFTKQILKHQRDKNIVDLVAISIAHELDKNPKFDRLAFFRAIE